MFGLFKKNVVKNERKIIDLISSELIKGITQKHSVEKITILVMANGILLVTRDMVGKDIYNNPKKYREECESALETLFKSRNSILDIIKEKKEGKNKKFAACHLLAVELAILTLYCGIDSKYLSSTKGAWLACWKGKESITKSIAWLRKYEEETGVEAIAYPMERESWNNVELVSLSKRVPSFIRGKTK